MGDIVNFSIREVMVEDAYEYAACHIACWRAAYNGIIPDDFLDKMASELDQRAESCRQTIISPGGYKQFYAEHDGKMVGRLIFSKSRDEDMPDAGEIGAIYLLEEYWGKGLGLRMMDFAIGMLKRDGHNKFIVWVLEENHRARRFYEKYGFSFDGTMKEITIGKPLIEIRYVKTLV